MLWLNGERSRRQWLLYIMSAIVATVFVLSAIPLAPEQTIPDALKAPLMTPIENFLRVLVSSLIYIGSPFAGSDLQSVPFAFLIGCFGVVSLIGLFLLLLRSGFTAKSISVWIAIALFGLGSALLTALGRAIKVTDLSILLTIRYTPHALSFWLALAGMATWVGFLGSRLGISSYEQARRYLSITILAVLCVLQIRISWAGLDNLRRVIQDPDLCLYTYILSDDTACFNQPFFARMPEVTQERTDQMLEYQIATFAEPPRAPISLNVPAFASGKVNIPANLPFRYEWQTTANLPDGCEAEVIVVLAVRSEAGADEVLTRFSLAPDGQMSELKASLDAYKGNIVNLISQVETSDPNCKNVEISRGVLRIW